MIMASRLGRAGRSLALLIVIAVSFSNPHHLSAQQAWSLPSPWSAQDIGNPAIAGSASFSQGAFTISASGEDIWGQSDQFTFVYQQITGDVEIIARVDSVTGANWWSKSGVMVRSSLAANAAHGYALVSAGKRVAFQRRLTDGGSSDNSYGPSVPAPYWVRLVRKGTTVTASSSANGITWSTIGSETIGLGSAAYVGIATTSHNNSAATTAAVSQVSINSLALPAPQQAADIGAPAIKGSTTYRQGVYGVHAGGSDIWGTSDQFHFVYQPLTGDGEVVARVQSITYSNTWAKTGVMIRETLAPDSRHAFALISAGAGYVFERRIDPAGITQSTAGSAGAAPGWVRLVRTGSRIDAYQSTNGATWTSMGSDIVPMTDTVYVGLATTSHNTTTATDAVLDNFRVTPSGSTTNQPPNVAITSPADGSTFTAGNNIVVNAGANDTDGTIARVDFFVGTTAIESDTTSPYSAIWANVTAGTYSLTAVAVDNDGEKTTSSVVSVRVDPAANQPPTVTLTAPANGASFTAPATVTLTATASDPENSLARVEFYSGTTLLNSDTTAPYSFSWPSVAAGTYTVTAVAYDNAGASASSTTATITVSTVTSNGLVGAYSLDEGTGLVAKDSSGVGPSGAIKKATWAAGHFGQALSFAGNGEVNLGDVDFTGAFTVEGWLLTRSLYTGTCGSFVMKTQDYGLELCGSKLLASIGSNGTWSRTLSQPLTSADLNTWKHVAMTYDGTTLRLFVGGALISSGAATHSTNNNPLLFGHWSPASEYFDGLIDEVRLYNRSLTQSEIQSDMNAPIGAGSGNRAPTATLTAPANGSTFTAPATVSLTATASDPDGTIARMEFYNGTTLLNTDTTSPYSFTWSNVAAGTYALKAIAYDNSGASTSSATSTVTVSQPTSTPPTGVVFMASPDHATMVISYELRIYANGADPNTAAPIATSDLGKPTPVANGDITVDRAPFFSGLAAANYVAAVAAIGSGGTSISTGVAFIR